VSKLPLSILPEAKPTINCFQALDYFQTGRAHLLLISNTPGIAGGAIGVITLEDVIEEIISEEIVDETDQYEDNQSKRRARRITTADVMRGIVERERRVDPANPNGTERSPLMGRSPSLRDGYRTTERARRRDPVNPSTNERSPLLGISSGLPASSDTTKGVVYAGTRSESPRS